MTKISSGIVLVTCTVLFSHVFLYVINVSRGLTRNDGGRVRKRKLMLSWGASTSAVNYFTSPLDHASSLF